MQTKVKKITSVAIQKCKCGRDAVLVLTATQKSGKKKVDAPLCVECARLLDGQLRNVVG